MCSLDRAGADHLSPTDARMEGESGCVGGGPEVERKHTLGELGQRVGMTYIFHDARATVSALDSGRLAILPSSPLVPKSTNESPRAVIAKLSTTTSASRAGSGSCVRTLRALLESAAEALPRVVRAEDASCLSDDAAAAALPLDTASAAAAALDRVMALVVCVCVCV